MSPSRVQVALTARRGVHFPGRWSGLSRRLGTARHAASAAGDGGGFARIDPSAARSLLDANLSRSPQGTCMPSARHHPTPPNWCIIRPRTRPPWSLPFSRSTHESVRSGAVCVRYRTGVFYRCCGGCCRIAG